MITTLLAAMIIQFFVAVVQAARVKARADLLREQEAKDVHMQQEYDRVTRTGVDAGGLLDRGRF